VTSRLAAFITGEGNWLPLAMALAFAAIVVTWARHRTHASRDLVMEAMNLFVGVTLTVMGLGHLLAVATKLAQGTLNGSPLLLFLIGMAIVVPSTLVVLHSNRATAARINVWMAVTLVVLGLINIPLAIPPLLNVAYARHVRPGLGTLIAAAFVLVNMALFAGGMLFLLSGARTFEEFRM
jgi:hypothetical protein